MINGDFFGLMICVDVVNGVILISVNCLFVDFEIDFYIMGINLDGLNINDGVGFMYLECLVEMVVEKGVDVGLVFDGDGDCIIVVDEFGNIVDGDKIMFICVKYLVEKNCLKKDIIVIIVMSNLGFYKVVEGIGLKDVVI